MGDRCCRPTSSAPKMRFAVQPVIHLKDSNRLAWFRACYFAQVQEKLEYRVGIVIYFCIWVHVFAVRFPGDLIFICSLGIIDRWFGLPKLGYGHSEYVD